MHTETTVELLTKASSYIAASVRTVIGADDEPEPAGDCDAAAHDLACALAVEARRLAPSASERQQGGEPECVKCTRCGHENWIQEGKAPCQVVPPDPAPAATRAGEAP